MSRRSFPSGRLAAVTTMVLGSLVSATPLGTLIEFSLTSASSPFRIAAGPDGNLWYTNQGTRAIGRITTSGMVTEFNVLASGGNPGSVPRQIRVGADGNIWFTDVGSIPAIGRITTSGAITEFSAGLNTPSLPAAITPGPDGNIWFSDQGTPTTPKAIGRITTSGQITEFSASLSANSLPGEITPGADGNLWFTDQGTTPKALGRIAPATGTATIYPLNMGSIPNGLRTGPDGNLSR